MRPTAWQIALVALLAGCASEPEAPRTWDPTYPLPPGARVEQRGAAVFQELPEQPRPRAGKPEELEARPIPEGRPVLVELWDGQKFRAEILGEDEDGYVLKQGGGRRHLPRSDVRTLTLLPRLVELPEEPR